MKGLSSGDEALSRAKLHILGGMDRLERGEIADAIAAFYDAFASAMWRYFVSDELRASLIIYKKDYLARDRTLFEVLKRSGIIDTSFSQSDFDYIDGLLNDVLEERTVNFDD
ncbi:MAG: hypothetical protein ACW985_07905, partial [Candidatus Thorarchaeota archaeon]